MGRSDKSASVTVRFAFPGDAAAMAALHAQCFPRPWDESAIGVFIADPASLCVIAPDAGEPSCRGLLIARAAADEAELLTLSVDPSCRRQGLATALLGTAIAALRLSTAKRLFLEVEEGNDAAYRLYRKFGAEQVGTRPGYYEHGADAAIFSLAL